MFRPLSIIHDHKNANSALVTHGCAEPWNSHMRKSLRDHLAQPVFLFLAKEPVNESEEKFAQGLVTAMVSDSGGLLFPKPLR